MLDQLPEARAETIIYSPPSTPLVIRGSRWKPLLAATLAFAMSIPVVDIRTQSPALRPILFAAVTLLVGIFYLYRVILPGRLTADAQGLRWDGFGRAWQVSWGDIAGFRVVRGRRFSSVVIDYAATDVQGAPRRPRGPSTVPDMLELKPEWVCDLLRQRLAVARTRDPVILPQIPAAVALREPVVAIPWLSAALAVVLLLVFLAELYFPVSAATASGEPSLATIVGFGANARNLVLGQSQWYRLAIAPFLHANTLHLIFNCFALLLAGGLLEGLVGRAWFTAIYAMGAVGGGLGSLLFNAPNIATVGASGAIMALFGAIFVCSFHFGRTPARDRLQAGAIFVLVPTLLTLGKTSDGMAVDFGAHLGGTITGALIGMLLLRLWGKDGDRPPHQKLAVAID